MAYNNSSIQKQFGSMIQSIDSNDLYAKELKSAPLKELLGELTGQKHHLYLKKFQGFDDKYQTLKEQRKLNENQQRAAHWLRKAAEAIYIREKEGRVTERYMDKIKDQKVVSDKQASGLYETNKEFYLDDKINDNTEFNVVKKPTTGSASNHYLLKKEQRTSIPYNGITTPRNVVQLDTYRGQNKQPTLEATIHQGDYGKGQLYKFFTGTGVGKRAASIAVGLFTAYQLLLGGLGCTKQQEKVQQPVQPVKKVVKIVYTQPSEISDLEKARELASKINQTHDKKSIDQYVTKISDAAKEWLGIRESTFKKYSKDGKYYVKLDASVNKANVGYFLVFLYNGKKDLATAKQFEIKKVHDKYIDQITKAEYDKLNPATFEVAIIDKDKKIEQKQEQGGLVQYILNRVVSSWKFFKKKKPSAKPVQEVVSSREQPSSTKEQIPVPTDSEREQAQRAIEALCNAIRNNPTGYYSVGQDTK